MAFKVTVNEVNKDTSLTTLATTLDTDHGTPTEFSIQIVKTPAQGSGAYPFLLVVVSRST